MFSVNYLFVDRLHNPTAVKPPVSHSLIGPPPVDELRWDDSEGPH